MDASVKAFGRKFNLESISGSSVMWGILIRSTLEPLLSTLRDVHMDIAIVMIRVPKFDQHLEEWNIWIIFTTHQLDEAV